MRRWWPVSLRLSAALAAGLACAGVFGLGGLWMRTVVYDGQIRAEEGRTQSELDRLADAYRQGSPAHTDTSVAAEMFEIVADSGQVVVESPNLKKLDPSWSPLPPAPAGANSIRTTATLRPGEHPNWREYRTYTVLGTVVDDVPAALVEPLGRDGSTLRAGQPEPTAENSRRYRLTLYLFVPPWNAQLAVTGVDHVLRPSLPLAVLFVAAIAWIVTGRALRPVEAIRREMAEIGEHALHRRVPVPPSKDEVARLATTTNETLDRLEQSLKQQQQFVADASHELRSPLANLRTGLEVALVHPDRADWPKAAGQALIDIQRLQDLTSDLLLLAETQAGERSATAVVDLDAMAQEQVAELEHRVPDGLAVHCAAEGQALVRGRPMHLDRLLRNLLDNARRHARSTVTVTVRLESTMVVLEVLDDGPGIPVADRERVFERFTRLDDARTRDAGGSGLGLAIARGIAIRHGGTLHVADSDTGARMVARLPQRETP